MTKHILPQPHLINRLELSQPGVVRLPLRRLKPHPGSPVAFDAVTGVSDGGGPVLKNVGLYLVFGAPPGGVVLPRRWKPSPALWPSFCTART
jgi:hypothetical protein